MKNTMKKLLCMALAIMLLVSAVPVFAAAAGEFTVDITVKDENDTILAQDSRTQNAGDQFTAQQYLDSVYSGWSGSFNPTKFWIKNDETGNDGQTVDGSHTITRTTRLVIKLQHKPVTLKIDVYFDGKYSRTVTKEVTYGSTVTLNNALATSVGLDNPIDVRTATLAKGQSFTANESSPNVQVFYTSGNSNSGSNSGSGSENGSGSTVTTVTLNIKNGEGSSYPVVWTDTRDISGDTTTVKDLLYYWYGNKSNSWQNSYSVTKAHSSKQGKDVGYEGTIAAGDTVTVVLSPKNNNNSNNNNNNNNNATTGDLSLVISANGAEVVKKTIQNFSKDTVSNLIKNNLDADWTSKYGFNEVAINGVTYYRSDLEVKAADKSVKISLSRKYSKDNSNKVYLHVYLNGDASTIAMTKDITGTYLMDDWKTDTNEILNYLKNNYYSAKDTSNAITIDGLYVSTDANGTFPSKYYADNKVSSKDHINDLLEDGFVHISVMLKNAKTKSSATADTSNPKTGDTIFVPVMVMGLTGSVLAAAYIFGKKRFAR